MNGVVRSVSDDEIVERKALRGPHGLRLRARVGGVVVGVRLLRREGVIAPNGTVACILTGHVLKDPDVTVGYHTATSMKAASVDLSAARPNGRWSNPPIKVADRIEDILRAMGG
jgi:threonine synthase